MKTMLAMFSCGNLSNTKYAHEDDVRALLKAGKPSDVAALFKRNDGTFDMDKFLKTKTLLGSCVDCCSAYKVLNIQCSNEKMKNELRDANVAIDLHLANPELGITAIRGFLEDKTFDMSEIKFLSQVKSMLDAQKEEFDNMVKDISQYKEAILGNKYKSLEDARQPWDVLNRGIKLINNYSINIRTTLTTVIKSDKCKKMIDYIMMKTCQNYLEGYNIVETHFTKLMSGDQLILYRKKRQMAIDGLLEKRSLDDTKKKKEDDHSWLFTV